MLDNERTDATGLSALSRRQVTVYELLKGLALERDQFHDWYYGATRTLEAKAPDFFAQAAHSIRELCDRLPGRIAAIPEFKSPLAPVKSLGPDFLRVKDNGYRERWVGEAINRPLGSILSRLENIYSMCKEPKRTARLKEALTAADPYPEALSSEQRLVRDRVFERMGGFFQNVAHHRHLPTEQEFREELDLFESLLLNYLTPCTATQQRELLALIAKGPNKEAAKRLNSLLLHKGANFAFFFEKLDNPAWLATLAKESYFARIPAPETGNDQQLIYRPHLPLVAVKRLAKSAPEQVTSILIKLDIPNNPVVEDQVLRCLAAITNKSCISKLCPLAERLSRQSNRLAGVWVNELLKAWVGAGAFSEAVAVAGAYLIATVEVHEASPGSDTWMVREISDRVFEILATRHPIEMARNLFGAFRLWVKGDQSRRNKAHAELATAVGGNAPEDTDYSGYWLEDFKIKPDGYRELEQLLATRLFQAASQVYRTADQSKILELDELLRSERLMVFARLRWQLYADFSNLTLDEARRDVFERMPQLNRADCTHTYEFAQLLLAHSKHYGEKFLSASEVIRFVDTVLSGPVDVNGDPMDGEYREQFQRKQLQPIAGLLQGDPLSSYKALGIRAGEIPVEDYKPFRSGGGVFEIQHVAPEEAEKLPSMSKPGLWSLLNEWQPKEDNWIHERGVQEDYDQLATKFAELVESHPGRFPSGDKWWENLERPPALHKLLDRAAARIENKPKQEHEASAMPTEDDWETWFGVAKWITRQRPIVREKTSEPDAGMRSLDPDWTWSRIVVARFLQAALKVEPALTKDHEGNVAELVRDLVDAEDPRLEHVNKADFDDWLTVAINSVRGRGLEVLLDLALKQKNTVDEVETWVFELIKSRLKQNEESSATFALLGVKLRLLLHLFGPELKSNQALLFPAACPAHRTAAIVAHFSYSHPATPILEALPDLPTVALSTFDAMLQAKGDAEQGGRRDFGSQLGTHIAFYCWNEAFRSTADGEAALDRFFAVAPKGTRAALVRNIGSIFKEQNAHTSKFAPRVMHIWERRHDAISKAIQTEPVAVSEYEGELAEFTNWLRCECLPFSWRYDHAIKSIALMDKAPRSHFLIDSVVELSEHPERFNEALQLLSALLSKPSDELRWSIQAKELAPVLAKGFESPDAKTQRLAEEVRDALLRLGFSDFLDLGR